MNFKDTSEVVITFFTMLGTIGLAWLGWSAKDVWFKQLELSKSISDFEKAKKLAITLLSEVDFLADFNEVNKQTFTVKKKNGKIDLILNYSFIEEVKNHLKKIDLADRKKSLKSDLTNLLVLKGELLGLEIDLRLDESSIALIKLFDNLRELKRVVSGTPPLTDEQSKKLESNAKKYIVEIHQALEQFELKILKTHNELSKKEKQKNTKF